jgi:hypothetical protein
MIRDEEPASSKTFVINQKGFFALRRGFGNCHAFNSAGSFSLKRLRRCYLLDASQGGC